MGKYDVHLTDALLLHSYASQRIDAAALPQIAAGRWRPQTMAGRPGYCPGHDAGRGMERSPKEAAVRLEFFKTPRAPDAEGALHP